MNYFIEKKLPPPPGPPQGQPQKPPSDQAPPGIGFNAGNVPPPPAYSSSGKYSKMFFKL